MKWSSALAVQVYLAAAHGLAAAIDNYLPGTTWTICANASIECAQANITFAYLVSDSPSSILYVQLPTFHKVLVPILPICVGSSRNAKCDDEHSVPSARVGDCGRDLGGQAKCRHSLLEVVPRPLFF